jgi:phosphoribosylformylglycinamidine synthase subunit PurS
MLLTVFQPRIAGNNSLITMNAVRFYRIGSGKNFLARLRGNFSAKSSVARMKAKIIITPKKAVVDPQGITVKKALEHMGYTGVAGVHIGKYIEIDLAPGTDKAAATKAINDAAHKLLSNPVIEDYKVEIE